MAGFGGAAVFLPAVAALYGVRSSVPIVTVAVLLGNLSRAWFYRRHLAWRVIALFCLGSVPAALLGSWVYVQLPASAIRRAIGAFLIGNVLWQRLHRPWSLGAAWQFAPLGAVSGFLSAVIGAIGPLAAPFFLTYFPVAQAYIGSESFCAAATHLAKTAAYGKLHVMGGRELSLGLSFGGIMVCGSYAAKLILDRLPRDKFLLLVEALLALVGGGMLLKP